MEFKMKEKIAVVTGASRGIGFAIAESLAAEGAKVICCSTTKEGSDRTADLLNEKYDAKCEGLAVDVSNIEAVESSVKSIVGQHGKIDILVNNAGISRDKLLLRMSQEDWSTVLNVNLNSVFYMTKAVMRPMLKQKWGRIINITSVVGVTGNPGQSNYAASKAGIIGFTKSIAKELGAKGITCNAVAPGFVQTDMIDSLPDDYVDNIIREVPLKRLGQPDDIANMTTFLASDRSSYITGQVINVDGGMIM
jgi:3-oxoacyl-[acyl-carrier protein] reductase